MLTAAERENMPGYRVQSKPQRGTHEGTGEYGEERSSKQTSTLEISKTQNKNWELA